MVTEYSQNNRLGSNAVDNVTVCPTGLYTAHTGLAFRPCIKIDLQSTYDVIRVVDYNRQDGDGMLILNTSI